MLKDVGIVIPRRNGWGTRDRGGLEPVSGFRLEPIWLRAVGSILGPGQRISLEGGPGRSGGTILKMYGTLYVGRRCAQRDLDLDELSVKNSLVYRNLKWI